VVADLEEDTGQQELAESQAEVENLETVVDKLSDKITKLEKTVTDLKVKKAVAESDKKVFAEKSKNAKDVKALMEGQLRDVRKENVQKDKEIVTLQKEIARLKKDAPDGEAAAKRQHELEMEKLKLQKSTVEARGKMETAKQKSEHAKARDEASIILAEKKAAAQKSIIDKKSEQKQKETEQKLGSRRAREERMNQAILAGGVTASGGMFGTNIGGGNMQVRDCTLELDSFKLSHMSLTQTQLIHEMQLPQPQQQFPFFGSMYPNPMCMNTNPMNMNPMLAPFAMQQQQLLAQQAMTYGQPQSSNMMAPPQHFGGQPSIGPANTTGLAPQPAPAPNAAPPPPLPNVAPTAAALVAQPPTPTVAPAAPANQQQAFMNMLAGMMMSQSQGMVPPQNMYSQQQSQQHQQVPQPQHGQGRHAFQFVSDNQGDNNATEAQASAVMGGGNTAETACTQADT